MSNRAHWPRKGYIPFVLVVGLEADEFSTTGLSASYTHTSPQGLTESWNLCCSELCRIMLCVLGLHIACEFEEFIFGCSCCLFVDHLLNNLLICWICCSPVCCCPVWCSLLSSLFTVMLHLEEFWFFLIVLKMVSIQSVFWPNLQGLCSLSALFCSPSFPNYPHLFHMYVLVQLCPLCWIIVCFTSCLFRSLWESRWFETFFRSLKIWWFFSDVVDEV